MDTILFLFTFFMGVIVGYVFVSIVKYKVIKEYRDEIDKLRNRLLKIRKK